MGRGGWHLGTGHGAASASASAATGELQRLVDSLGLSQRAGGLGGRNQFWHIARCERLHVPVSSSLQEGEL